MKKYLAHIHWLDFASLFCLCGLFAREATLLRALAGFQRDITEMPGLLASGGTGWFVRQLASFSSVNFALLFACLFFQLVKIIKAVKK